MANITVKNIPDDLYEKLKKQADRHRRSINQEIIYTLEKQLQSKRMNPDELQKKARELREKTSDRPLKDEELKSAIDEGRP